MYICMWISDTGRASYLVPWILFQTITSTDFIIFKESLRLNEAGHNSRNAFGKVQSHIYLFQDLVRNNNISLENGSLIIFIAYFPPGLTCGMCSENGIGIRMKEVCYSCLSTLVIGSPILYTCVCISDS